MIFCESTIEILSAGLSTETSSNVSNFLSVKQFSQDDLLHTIYSIQSLSYQLGHWNKMVFVAVNTKCIAQMNKYGFQCVWGQGHMNIHKSFRKKMNVNCFRSDQDKEFQTQVCPSCHPLPYMLIAEPNLLRCKKQSPSSAPRPLWTSLQILTWDRPAGFGWIVTLKSSVFLLIRCVNTNKLQWSSRKW